MVDGRYFISERMSFSTSFAGIIVSSSGTYGAAASAITFNASFRLPAPRKRDNEGSTQSDAAGVH